LWFCKRFYVEEVSINHQESTKFTASGFVTKGQETGEKK